MQCRKRGYPGNSVRLRIFQWGITYRAGMLVAIGRPRRLECVNETSMVPRKGYSTIRIIRLRTHDSEQTLRRKVLSMRHRLFRPFAVLLTLLLVLSSLLPVAGRAVLAQGTDDGAGYTDAVYDFEVTWDDPWSAQTDEDAAYLALATDTATLLIRGEDDDLSPQDRLQQEVDQVVYTDGTTADITSDDEGVAAAEWRSDAQSRLVRVIALPDAGANVIVTLVAPGDAFDDSVEDAGTVMLNGDPVLGSASNGEDDADRDDTGDTIGDGSGDDDDDADGPNLKLPTPEPLGDGVDGDTYTSPNFGYSFSWDDSIWEIPDDGEVSEQGYDLLTLYGPSGNLLIYAFEDYGGDPADCLQGEADYFSFESGITDWEQAENADGDPIAGETDDSAYGVYTLTYTDPDDDRGPGRELVDYIECRSLGDDAVLVIVAISPKSRYNSHIDDVIEVTDTIELYDVDAEATETPDDIETPEKEETPDVSETPEDEGEEPGSRDRPGLGDDVPGKDEEGTPESGGSVDQGEAYTSDTFGYSLAIPATWTVEDQESSDTEDVLVLNNGVSTVTVWATTEFSGDTLLSCVEFAADSSGHDLALQVQAGGEPFQGNDDLSAFAAYTYDNDGTPQTWFVKCQWLDEGSSVLIIIQDVPTESYAQQRQARRQIENLIRFP